MKKIIAIVMTVCLAVGVCVCAVACGEKADYTVGISQLMTHPALDAATQGFKDALTEEMEKAGKTVKIDYKNASEDTSVCTTIAQDFVAKKYDLIMANATPALQAASSATAVIPILGTSVTDYDSAVPMDTVKNVSGTSDLANLDKQAQMIIDLLPNAKKVALLYCSAEANSLYQVEKVKAYLDTKGIEAVKESYVDSNDLSAVLNKIIAPAAGYDCMYIPTDNTAAKQTETIYNICVPAKMPIIAGEEGICEGCGIATLSINYYDLGRKTGLMAAQILLEGKDISTMEIQYDTNQIYKYNEKICELLGIEVPDNYVKI